MKLATMTVDGGAPEIGLVKGDQVVRLKQALPGLPTSMIELIARWDAVRGDVERATDEAATLPMARVQLLPPISNPGKIMAMGLNYADHVREGGAAMPQHQIWFAKCVSAVHAPFAPIQVPKVSDAVDYEVEMVFVVGKRGRHISRAAAPGHVFGYCVGNDVSVRDWQLRTPQGILGKSFDTHAPFGPWITTADEVGDPHRLDIRCLVNGDVRQNSNTREFIFDVYEQIAYLSQSMTLEVGDVIYTGTPGGVGVAMKPPIYLKAGDRVRCEIDGLGAIEATLENEA